MKRCIKLGLLCTFLIILTACTATGESFQQAEKKTAAYESQPLASGDIELERDQIDGLFTIRISVNGTVLTGILENNATTRALIAQMPMTLSMQDLYGREMCYHYGADAFPVSQLRNDAYEVGDMIYWPPSGSLVILYQQNGERFSRQHLGHIESGVEIFETTGDASVTFELLSEK